MAAPLADSSQQSSSSQEIKQVKRNPEHRKIGFSNKDVEMWINPCSSEGMIDSSLTNPDILTSVNGVSWYILCEKL